MLLADAIAPVPAAFAWNWVVMCGLVASIGLQLWDRLSPKASTVSPQPLRVREDQECASRADLDALARKLDQDIEGVHRKIGGSERGAREHSEAGLKEMRQQVAQLTGSVARVEQAAEMHTAQLAGLDATLKEILREIPRSA